MTNINIRIKKHTSFSNSLDKVPGASGRDVAMVYAMHSLSLLFSNAAKNLWHTYVNAIISWQFNFIKVGQTKIHQKVNVWTNNEDNCLVDLLTGFRDLLGNFLCLVKETIKSIFVTLLTVGYLKVYGRLVVEIHQIPVRLNTCIVFR